MVTAYTERVAKLPGHEGGLRACEFSPDGSRFLSAGDDGSLRLWDARTSTQLVSFEGHTDGVVSCSFAPDGETIVSASHVYGTVRLWDVSDGRPIWVAAEHGSRATNCRFGPGGRWIASSGPDRTVRIWSAERGRQMAMLPLPGNPECLAVHPRTGCVAAGDDGGGVYLADLVA